MAAKHQTLLLSLIAQLSLGQSIYYGGIRWEVADPVLLFVGTSQNVSTCLTHCTMGFDDVCCGTITNGMAHDLFCINDLEIKDKGSRLTCGLHILMYNELSLGRYRGKNNNPQQFTPNKFILLSFDEASLQLKPKTDLIMILKDDFLGEIRRLLDKSIGLETKSHLRISRINVKIGVIPLTSKILHFSFNRRICYCLEDTASYITLWLLLILKEHNDQYH
ncbi:hypothetical protein BDB01DRAFT_835747 [Pilobolus umbonatus]|nr:hypothetical protein BDB01DRAFT_835747 [Pilobolus umbonatus]